MTAATSRSHVEEWIAAYEDAWRTPDTSSLSGLFTEDATYQLWPYDPAIEGLSAIKEMWVAEREGPDETFTMSSSIVALENETAVARVEVAYGDPVTQEYRDLWIMRFAADGRCESFEEWPFWPGRGSTASDSA
jgi:ketosteroid isomerase-like protein